MRVYVSTYKKYNGGSLRGSWLGLGDFSSKEDFLAECKKIHSDEPEPELMFQDYENIPSSLISESWISDVLFELLNMCVDDLDALTVYLNSQSFASNVSAEELVKSFEERYAGKYASFLEYAYEYIEATGMLESVPESIKNYFDYESFARDLEFDYDYVDGFIFLKN